MNTTEPKPPNITKILFLDVDGVLNNTKTLEEAADRREFDPICGICLSFLKDIVEKTDCNIVLSSAWRLDKWNVKKLRRAFFDVGIHHNFPQTPNLNSERHFEIEDWLAKHNVDPAIVVVLDDDGDAKIQNVPANIKEIFLQTSRHVGLDRAIADKAIEFFNQE